MLFNEHVPEEVGYIDQLLTKESLKRYYWRCIKCSGIAKTAEFLDNIKGIGYHFRI